MEGDRLNVRWEGGGSGTIQSSSQQQPGWEKQKPRETGPDRTEGGLVVNIGTKVPGPIEPARTGITGQHKGASGFFSKSAREVSPHVWCWLRGGWRGDGWGLFFFLVSSPCSPPLFGLIDQRSMPAPISSVCGWAGECQMVLRAATHRSQRDLLLVLLSYSSHFKAGPREDDGRYHPEPWKWFSGNLILNFLASMSYLGCSGWGPVSHQ